MLNFRDYHWLLVHSASRFSADIGLGGRPRDKVRWELNLRYIAGGAQWRRVRSSRRPMLTLGISSFEPPARKWTALEKIDFWDEPDCDEHGWPVKTRSGYLDLHFHPTGLVGGWEEVSAWTCWRVARREGAFFTVELAGTWDGRPIPRESPTEEVAVTADGSEERAAPEPERWTEQTDFYLIDAVPFGTVTVLVPRNARDPEAHALARARQLLGVGEPEHVEVTDFTKFEKSTESLHDDLYVKLHFHNYYED